MESDPLHKRLIYGMTSYVYLLVPRKYNTNC